MFRRGFSQAIMLIAFIVVTSVIVPVFAQDNQNPLDFCRQGAFSTEEDFRMLRGEPFDGNPYISDGDLLSPNGQVCARNRDLLNRFDISVDLGLDAVHIIRFQDGDQRAIIAFSTELDSKIERPFGTFSSGDLLFTNGAIIPNMVLTDLFKIGHDIGLDGLQFIGREQSVIEFAEKIEGVPPDDWLRNPGQLQELIKDFDIDIWFSIEGTHGIVDDDEATPEAILDGDILSVSGSVIAHNGDLLPPSVPAGLPKRGVDYGVDAIALPTNDEGQIFFSTEILNHGKSGFTDGDVLIQSGGIVITNDSLIAAFNPASDFLGLDALWLAPITDGRPFIESICGDERSIIDFENGAFDGPVPIGAPGVGLYKDANYPGPGSEELLRPCGRYVPFEGLLPQTGIKRFRVAYREASQAVPAVGAANGIQTQWLLKVLQWRWVPMVGLIPVCPSPNLADPSSYLLLETDANGWMDASKYIGAEDGTLTGCEHDLKLAVWNTDNDTSLAPVGVLGRPTGPTDPNGHYATWLEWETSGGVLDREPIDHHVQLDNTLPTITELQVRTLEGKVVPRCNVDDPARGNEFQVWSQFDDDYHWSFGLQLVGGMGGAASYGPRDYRFSPDDPIAGVKNTDATGTTPDVTTVHIHNIRMLDLGAENFVKCCYMLNLTVRDRAIRHDFNRIFASDVSPYIYSSAYLLFAATPP